MAVDQFIKIGDLEGEADDDAHGGEIKVLSWSWGMSQSGTLHLGTAGSGAGKVSVQDFSFTKFVDKSSANLMKACCKGTHWDSGAKLTVRKAGGSPLEYIVIEMKPVMITKVAIGGMEQDLVTEQVSLNFATVKMTYAPQKPDGSGDAAVEGGFDIAKNAEM